MKLACKNTQIKTIRKIFFAVLYGLLSAIGINMFLSHANSYSVGVPGIAQLLHAILLKTNFNLSISLLMIFMNIPLFLFAWRCFGLRYITYSLIAVASNITFLEFIPQTMIVSDKLTNTLLGAALIGIGVGLCFNNGFSTGGTDVIVTYVQMRFKKKIGFVNNLINGIVLVAAALCFDLGRSVFSLIGMLVTSYSMDYFFIQQKDVNIMIFTKQSAKLAAALKNFVHGATLLNGTGIYTDQPTDIIIIVAQKGQLKYLKQTIQLTDPNAFISVQGTDADLGNYRQVFED